MGDGGGILMWEAAFWAEMVGFSQWGEGGGKRAAQCFIQVLQFVNEVVQSLLEVFRDLKAFSEGKKMADGLKQREALPRQMLSSRQLDKNLSFSSQTAAGWPSGTAAGECPRHPCRYAYAHPEQLNFFYLFKALEDLQWQGG